MSLAPTPPESFCSCADFDDLNARGRTRQRDVPFKTIKRRAQDMESVEESHAARRQRLDLSQTRQPVFSPPSPDESRSRKRSPSPTRKQLASLRDTGVPCIKIERGGIAAGEDNGARALWEKLHSAATGAVIPSELKERLMGDQLSRDVMLTASMFSAPGATPNLSDDSSISRLWKRVQHILREAHACDSFQKDENAWSEVVRLVIRTAIYDFAVDREDDVAVTGLDIVNIQSQSVDKEYLPRFQLAPGYCDRKTDLAIAFSPKHRTFGPLRQRMLELGLPLSHMRDTYTSTIALAHPVEIKPASGNADEAELQLAIFNAGALAFLPDSTPPPLLGWSIIGHSWNPSIAWKNILETNVNIRGPTLTRNVGTKDVESLFTLFAALRSGFAWMKEEYWPLYEAAMSARLQSE